MTPEQKKRIEDILREYPQNRSDLIINTVERDNLDCAPSAITYGQVTSTPSGRINSLVEDFAEKVDTLNEDARRLYRKIVLVEGAVERLKAVQKKVIRMVYFDGYTFEEVARMLERDSRTIHRWKDDAFEKFSEIDLEGKYDVI